MFTRAHAILARYLAEETQIEEMKRHKRSLGFGSIIPDRSPRQRMKDHEFTATWEDTKQLIRDIETKTITNARSERAACRKMGMVLHYLADYFTCPHNPSCGMRAIGHAPYERRQAFYIIGYLYSPGAAKQVFFQKNAVAQIKSEEELFSYIERMHGLYLQEKGHTPEDDCRWILGVCACTAMVLMPQICARKKAGEIGH